ncbi:MAG: DUF748 domain-containing protein [Methylophilaceae bacterium]
MIGLCLFYLLFSYLGVNPLAKKLVPWIAEKQLNSKASVGHVAFDPFRLKTTVDQFKLSDKNNVPLASFDQLTVDFEASGFFSRAWKFKEISLTSPKGVVAISHGGKLNWADLIAKLNEDKSKPSNTIPRVVIKDFSIKNGNFQYADNNRPTAFKAELSPIDFKLDDFSTLPKDRGEYLFLAKFAEHGGSLKWKGEVAVNPVVSNGTLAINHIKIAKIFQSIKGVQLPFKATGGDVGANFSYNFSLAKDQPKVTLKGLELNINQLAANLQNHDIQNAGNFHLAKVKLTAPRLDFSMQNQAKLNVQNINLALNGLAANFGQDNATLKQTALSINHAAATLPKLSYSKQTQLQFEQLNIKLAEINLQNNKDSLFSLPQLDINNVALDLAKNHASIAQVSLTKGLVNAKRDQSGQLNWQTAFVSNETAPSKQPVQNNTNDKTPFTLDIADVALKNWQIAMQDQSFIHPLQFNVADVNVNFAVNNPQGDWAVSHLQSQLNALTLKSTLKPMPVASLAKVELNLSEILLDKQKVDIQSILLSGLKTDIFKTANAPMNWQQILETRATPLQKATQTNIKASAKPSQPEWAINLKKLALDNSQLHIEDHSLTQAVVLDVEKLAVEVNDASLDLARALPIKASFAVKQGGQFSTQGKLTPMPLKVDADLKLTALSFKPFAPNLNQFALLKLNNGSGNLHGKLHLKNEKSLALTLKGGFSVDKLNLIEEANDAPFLAWNKLSSDSLDLSLAPNRLHISTLTIDNPIGKFIINEDKTTNISKILRSTAKDNTNTNKLTPNNAIESATKSVQAPEHVTKLETAQTSNSATSTEMAQAGLISASAPSTQNISAEAAKAIDTSPIAFPVTIETVRINNAGLEFADLSLTPQFGTQIHTLNGVVNSVSTNPNTTAQVELEGKVDDYGAARIQGTVKPFKVTDFTDLKLSFTNLEMNRLTPYSGKFAGRRIDSGKLSVDLEYKIKQRQLTGDNKFVIHKIKLGEKVDSKEAANLPLDLAIAILEDSDGVIDLDLPITGSLDDPKYSYGSIVWQAIKNVLGKIVTAPFRALGKLFGGNGDKLEAITFETGKATLSPPELEKLKAVATALSKRQGLALGIVPGFDKALDTRAIQESTLRQQVAEEMGLKLTEGQQAGPIDLNNPKVQKAIDTLYDNLTKKGLFKRLVSKLEKPKAGHFEEAQEKLTTSIEVKDADLQALAKARGVAIQKQLVELGIAMERAQMAKVEAGKADEKEKTVNTRLTLDIKKANNQAVDTTKTDPKSEEKTTQ